MSSKMYFKISSALKSLIGRELITDEFVAVFELVKNSFDAHARNVIITFENQYDPEKAKIIISDDGDGMTKDDLKNKWLFVAYSSKREEQQSEDYRNNIQSRRIYAGAKGVGRFSCDRLGAHLRLITKTAKTNFQSLYIDWSSFEKDSTEEFIDVKVVYDDNISNFNRIELKGTVLEISGLRDLWNRSRILKLKKSLSKLINPVQGNDTENFSISIVAKDEVLSDKKERNSSNIINGPIENFVFEALGLKTTQIEVEIIDGGQFIKTTLTDRGQMIYSILEKNHYNLSDIRIHLFQLNRNAKSKFTKTMGIEPVNFGSIFVYKNGFRIYPYGEPGEDVFGIDKRKQQGYNRYLGTRDLIGRILISNNEDKFKETTSRDGGFIKDKYYEELIELFTAKALKRLEKYAVDIIKWGDPRIDKDTGAETPEVHPQEVKRQIVEIIASLAKTKDILSADYDKNFLSIIGEKSSGSIIGISKSFLKIAELNNDKDLIRKAKQADSHVKSLIAANKEVEHELDSANAIRKNIEVELDRAKKQSLFQRSIIGREKADLISLQHQITYSADNILASFRNLISSVNEGLSKEILLEQIGLIVIEVQKIQKASSYVTKANFNMEAVKIRADMIGFVDDYIQNVFIPNENYVYKSKALRVVVRNDDKLSLIKKFSPLELTIILDNLISNSKKAGASLIELEWKKGNDDNIVLLFVDNGRGIPDEQLDKIFDFSFTTTNGSGIGLSHVKQLMNGLNGSVSVCNSGQVGVTFLLEFRK